MTDRFLDFSLEEGTMTPRQREFLESREGTLPIKGIHLTYSNQVHGDQIIVVNESLASQEALIPADGLISNVSEIPLAIRTADCLPVFLYDPSHRCIGLVHAGWRGSQKEIVRKAVEKMQSWWDVRPCDLQIAFGAAMRSCCYQVGEEFRNYFSQDIEKREDHLYLDLIQANKRQLIGLGITEDQVFDCGLCTCCDRRFFSYRREGSRAGRMISVIMLKSKNS